MAKCTLSSRSLCKLLQDFSFSYLLFYCRDITYIEMEVGRVEMLSVVAISLKSVYNEILQAVA